MINAKPMNKGVMSLICCMVISALLPAQEAILLPEKQGSFKTTYNISNGLGADNYGVISSYSNAEIEASKKKLEKVVAVFRQLPVLNENKGFDATAYISNNVPDTKFGYGMPTSISFFLETWSGKNGKEVKWTMEPPQFYVQLNQTWLFCSQGFNVSGNSYSSIATGQDINEETAAKATVALREMFFCPAPKDQIAPGIDRYGETYVLFNPDRPAYWVQVSIREVYQRLMNYWKVQPDARDREAMLAVIAEQYSNFTEVEKDGFAYRGDKDIFNKIGSEKNDYPVLIPNPEYWNRNLPRSAVQFLSIEIPDEATNKKKMEKAWKSASGYYYIYKLFSELDLSSLSPIIE